MCSSDNLLAAIRDNTRGFFGGQKSSWQGSTNEDVTYCCGERFSFYSLHTPCDNLSLCLLELHTQDTGKESQMEGLPTNT